MFCVSRFWTSHKIGAGVFYVALVLHPLPGALRRVENPFALNVSPLEWGYSDTWVRFTCPAARGLMALHMAAHCSSILAFKDQSMSCMISGVGQHPDPDSPGGPDHPVVAPQPAAVPHPGRRVHGRRHTRAAHQPPKGLPLQVWGPVTAPIVSCGATECTFAGPAPSGRWIVWI